MNKDNIDFLSKCIPIWEYFKTNKCVPLINLPMLEQLSKIYQDEINPSPSHIYNSKWVENMIIALFIKYENLHIKEST